MEYKVKYKDNIYSYDEGVTLLDISRDFKDNYKGEILCARVNGIVTSLNYKLNDNITLDFVDIYQRDGVRMYERSTIFLLIKAIKDVLHKNLCVEHSVDKSVYCTVSGINAELLEKVKVRMNELVNLHLPIEKLTVDRLKMINYFNACGQTDEADLLSYVSNTYVTTYKLDDIYGYFYGEMLINTSYITKFELTYLKDNMFVLTVPNRFDGYDIKPYVHHELFFKEVKDFSDWTKCIGTKTFRDINNKLSEGKWNDLIFMSEATFNKSLLDIADTVASKKGIKLVLIAGPSSSGKTTTSKKLEMFLEGKGFKPLALSVDDYFKERDETPLDENGFKDYESVNALDIDLFNKQLSELIDGKEVTLPTFNFKTGKKEYKRTIKLDENSILVIEGLHSLNDELTKSISSDKKFKIYISPLTGLNINNHCRLNSTDNRLLRRMVRDNLRRGYDASATLESWDRVRVGETKYVFPYQDKADVVLNTSLIYEMCVLKVYAEPLLFSVKKDDPNYGEAIRLINLLRLLLPMSGASIPLDSILREFIGSGCFE